MEPHGRWRAHARIQAGGRVRLTSERMSLLLSYGLTEYEARAYLVMLESPALPATVLSRAARVARNRIYEVIASLQERDLVDVELGDGGARLYRAKPFSVFLEHRVRDLQGEISKLEAARPFVSTAFQPQASDNAGGMTPGTVRLLMGRRSVAREIDRILTGAQTNVVASSSVGGVERVLRYVEPFAGDDETSFDNRGIDIELYLPRGVAEAGVLDRYDPAWHRRARWVDAPFDSIAFVVDGNFLLWVHPLPDDSHPRVGHDFAILSTDVALARDFSLMLERTAMASAAFGQRRGMDRPHDGAGPFPGT